eukprot:s5264_g3.t1
MGKRAASGSAAKRGRDGAAKDDEKTKHPRGVPLWKLFVKSPLRSWPDENGCMLLTERKSPAAYFTGAKVKEIASSATSLCVSKPAMGVSLTAASLEACAAAMAMNSKKDRFSLSALVAVLDGVPDAVLSPAGLLHARDTMKKMSRLPKRAKLAGVLELMQALAGKAQSMREELRAYQEKLVEQDHSVEDPIYDETSDE